LGGTLAMFSNVQPSICITKLERKD
jgi:hypothetical protein